MRLAQIKCVECGNIDRIRRPASEKIFCKFLAHYKCPRCHPEALRDVCASCRIPLWFFKKGRRYKGSGFPKDFCSTCLQSLRRHYRRERVTN